MTTHEIQNRNWRTPTPSTDRYPHRRTVVCTCGQTFTAANADPAAARNEAGLAWQDHRDAEDPKPLAERFADFHQAHPSVYAALVRLTRQAHDAGARRIGIGQLFEVLRWEWVLSALPAADEAWKLNNDYRSRYSRLIMQNELWAGGMFETRRLTT